LTNLICLRIMIDFMIWVENLCSMKHHRKQHTSVCWLA